MSHLARRHIDPSRSTRRRVVVGLLSLLGAAALVALWTHGEPAVTSSATPSPSARSTLPSVAHFAAEPSRQLTMPIANAPADATFETQPAEPISGLAQLRRTRAQEELIWKAEQLAIAKCMQERGFSYSPLPFDDTDDLEFEIERPQPDDVEAATELGYGIARGIDANNHPEPLSEDLPSQFKQLSAAQRKKFQEALIGPDVAPQHATPDKGWESLTLPNGATVTWYNDSCYSRARKGIRGENYAQRELLDAHQELKAEVDKQVETDPAYVAAIGRWRDCMKARGFEYTAPGAAAEDLGAAYSEGKLNLSELRERETKVAAADSACYGEVGLRTIATEARARGETQVLERERSRVTEAKREQDEELTRAHLLVAAADHDDG